MLDTFHMVGTTNLFGEQNLGADHAHAAWLQLGMQNQLALPRLLQSVERQVHLVFILVLWRGWVKQDAHNIKHTLRPPDQLPAATIV